MTGDSRPRYRPEDWQGETPGGWREPLPYSRGQLDVGMKRADELMWPNLIKPGLLMEGDFQAFALGFADERTGEQTPTLAFTVETFDRLIEILQAARARFEQ